MISNSTVLIYLAKLGRLELLREFFGTVHIPEAVKREVVDEGKRLQEADAVLVENAIAEGWIVVHNIKPSPMLRDLGIDAGEEEAISLALKRHEKEVLMDQTHARVAAELFGVTPRGTLSVLLQALRKNRLTYDEYEEHLAQLIDFGFRLKEEVYLQALQEGKKAAGKV